MAVSNSTKQQEKEENVDSVAPLIQRLKSQNKWSFHGDYLVNFEKNLIGINRSMQQIFRRSVLVTSHWFRALHRDLILPQNVDIIIGQFYTLPRCANCGMYDNLWLNLCDGYIGCGRQQWDGSGGNACALKHYSALRQQVESSNNERRQYFSLVVKLGTIGEHGADVFCYKRDFMVMDAVFVDDEDDDVEMDAVDIDKNRKRGTEQWGEHSNKLYIDELQPLLAYWGIEMGKMYKFDKTMNEVEIELNADFVNNLFRSLR